MAGPNGLTATGADMAVWLSAAVPLQVVGHMFALPLVLDLVARTGAEKAEVDTLIDNIVGT